MDGSAWISWVRYFHRLPSLRTALPYCRYSRSWNTVQHQPAFRMFRPRGGCFSPPILHCRYCFPNFALTLELLDFREMTTTITTYFQVTNHVILFPFHFGNSGLAKQANKTVTRLKAGAICTGQPPIPQSPQPFEDIS